MAALHGEFHQDRIELRDGCGEVALIDLERLPRGPGLVDHSIQSGSLDPAPPIPLGRRRDFAAGTEPCEPVSYENHGQSVCSTRLERIHFREPGRTDAPYWLREECQPNVRDSRLQCVEDVLSRWITPQWWRTRRDRRVGERGNCRCSRRIQSSTRSALIPDLLRCSTVLVCPANRSNLASPPPFSSSLHERARATARTERQIPCPFGLLFALLGVQQPSGATSKGTKVRRCPAGVFGTHVCPSPGTYPRRFPRWRPLSSVTSTVVASRDIAGIGDRYRVSISVPSSGTDRQPTERR